MGSAVGATAGCGRTLPVSALNSFIERPKAILRDDERKALAFHAREFSKEPRAHAPLLQLASDAAEADREIIGRGIAMGYYGCLAQKPEVARAIVRLVGRMPETARRGFQHGLEETRPEVARPVLSGEPSQQDPPQRLFNIGVVHSLDQRSLKLADPFEPPLR